MAVAMEAPRRFLQAVEQKRLGPLVPDFSSMRPYEGSKPEPLFASPTSLSSDVLFVQPARSVAAHELVSRALGLGETSREAASGRAARANDWDRSSSPRVTYSMTGEPRSERHGTQSIGTFPELQIRRSWLSDKYVRNLMVKATPLSPSRQSSVVCGQNPTPTTMHIQLEHTTRPLGDLLVQNQGYLGPPVPHAQEYLETRVALLARRLQEGTEVSDYASLQASVSAFERLRDALPLDARHSVPLPTVVLQGQVAREFFDQQARSLIGMPGEEFLRRWDAGEFRDILHDPDRPEIADMAALIPFVR